MSVTSNADYTAENCTFSANRAGQGSSVYVGTGARARFDFCTFADGRASDAAIGGGTSGAVSAYASTFFDNYLQNGTTESAAIDPPSGLFTFTSLGYNAFTTASAPAALHATDTTFTNLGSAYRDFGTYTGGWVESYQSFPIVGVEDGTPAVAPGVIPPPEHDSRGYDRIFNVSADYGANEFGGEITDEDGDLLPSWWELLWGFDPFTANDTTVDLDNDQQDLWGEYVWLTDPFDGTSAFSIDHLTGTSNITLNWASETGYVYRIHTSSNMTLWDPGPFVQATSAASTFMDTTTGLTRLFYQVRRVGTLPTP